MLERRVEEGDAMLPRKETIFRKEVLGEGTTDLEQALPKPR